MSKKKTDTNIRPPKAANPPEITRDPITGKYLTSRREALKQWFSSAKDNACSKSVASRTIDPKQAVYGDYTNKRNKKNG